MDNLNRIIEEHPDAVNRDGLIRLRDSMKKRGSGTDAELTTNHLDLIAEGETRMVSEMEGWQPIDEYDRHQFDDKAKSHSKLVRENQTYRRMKSHMYVEHPSRPAFQLRHPDSKHQETVPEQSQLPQPESSFPLMHIEGDRVIQRGLDHPGLLR